MATDNRTLSLSVVRSLHSVIMEHQEERIFSLLLRARSSLYPIYKLLMVKIREAYLSDSAAMNLRLNGKRL